MGLGGTDQKGRRRFQVAAYRKAQGPIHNIAAESLTESNNCHAYKQHDFVLEQSRHNL